MALISEKGIESLIRRGLSKDRYTGLYYEDPETKEKKYVTVQAQPGTPPDSTRSKRQVRRINRSKGWHPEAKKVEAATLHVAIGNMARVSELTKVPLPTLRKWQDQPWWLTCQQRVKREAQEETDSKFTKLIDKAIGKLEKAIEEGDYIYDFKKGTLVKIPMTGRDLSVVTGVVFDKRQLLRGEATKISKAPDTEKHLQDLAERFAALVRDKVTPQLQEKVIEGEHQIIEAELSSSTPK